MLAKILAINSRAKTRMGRAVDRAAKILVVPGFGKHLRLAQVGCVVHQLIHTLFHILAF